MLLDLHTHQPQLTPSGEILQVQSLRPSEALHLHDTPTLLYRSVGLHPWYEEELTTTGLAQLKEALRQPHVLALGEMGLDKVCPTPLARQEEYFRYQVELAEALDLPIILHLVKAQDELLRLRKELRPQTPWIIHGFRGKGAQAQQLLQQGLFLSFGALAHPEALTLAYRAKRLFLETDDRPDPDLRMVYQLTATRLGVTEEALEAAISQLAQNLFAFL